MVTGATDLPDGAGIIVNLTLQESAKVSGDYHGSDVKVYVAKGHFTAHIQGVVSLLANGEFHDGPHVVEVMFTPRGQEMKVVSAVGADGENLTGSLVKNEYGFNVLQTVPYRFKCRP
jgi:hypothetical protein